MKNNPVLDWYSGLAPRDQLVLKGGAVAVLLIVLLTVFLQLHRNIAEASTQVQKQQEDLDWMTQVGEVLAAAGPGPIAAATSESLVVLIDRSARESGLSKALTGTQPGTGGSMRVQLEQADFNLFTSWLGRLSSQHGVKVDSASITGSSTPGIVNATVQLRAAR